MEYSMRKAAGVALTGLIGLFAVAQQALAAEVDRRYVLRGDTVYDRKTDLTWKRCAEGMRWTSDVGCVGVEKEFTYDEALGLAGGGWRVPTLDELKTLVRSGLPSIDQVAFPDTPPVWFWTSTRYDASFVWFVGFGDGNVFYSYRDVKLAVRLVRGGQ